METIHLRIEKKGREGKTVTIISGFTRRLEEIEDLTRKIKTAFGVGGTFKCGRLEIQGNLLKQIAALLQEFGFRVKKP